MEAPLTVRVKTSQLRALLEETPEVLVTLERMATEKIAEEIVKKIHGKAVNVDKMVEDLISRVNTQLLSQYAFPKKAREVVEHFTILTANTHYSSLKRKMENDARDIITKELEHATKKLELDYSVKVTKELESHRKMIIDLARAEFVKVLKEVKAWV